MKLSLLMLAFITLTACSKTNEPDLTSAWTYCKLLTKTQLKSPASAKFPYSSKLRKRETKKADHTEYTYYGYVDAQNGFGATIRKNFTCKVSGAPGSKKVHWQLISFKFTS